MLVLGYIPKGEICFFTYKILENDKMRICPLSVYNAYGHIKDSK